MRRTTKPALATAAILSLFTSLLVTTPAVADPGEFITVTVVRDTDGNGSQGPTDHTPVAGMQVVVAGTAGAPLTQTTGFSGELTFNLATLTGPYRVYTTIPAEMDYLKPAPAGGAVVPVPGETTYDPLVAFVDLAAGDSPDLLQAVWNPDQWVQPDARVLYTTQNSPPDVNPLSAGTYPLIGGAVRTHTGSSLHGAAYDRWSGTAYYSTFVRRGALVDDNGGVGSNGAIYRQAVVASSAAELWVTLPAGTTQHYDLPVDPAIFGVVGKEGLGDIQLSPDGETLYVVNLFDRSLYTISTDDGIVQDVDLIPVPDGLAGREDDWRPFGLGFFDGVLYVGGVDSAESVQSRAQLHAYVWTFQDGSFSADAVFDHSLDYLKGSVWYEGLGYVRSDDEQHWNPWKSVWDGIENWGGDNGGAPVPWIRYPQPMLTDIAVDTDGSLVLAFRDRTGAQGGFDTPPPVGTGSFGTMSGGDLIRVCNIDGEYEWECTDNNVGGGTAGPSELDTVAEYYVGEWIVGHEEVAFGSAAYRANGTLLATGLVSAGNSGFIVLNDDSGTRTGSIGVPSPTFFKAGGLGAVTLMASNAIPAQLGNRVWFDTNRNGLQDPGEPDLPGVTVTLINSSNVEVADTFTDSDGLYYFGGSNLIPGDWTVQFDYSTVQQSSLPPGVTLSELAWTTPNVPGDEQLKSRAIPTVLGSSIARTAPVTIAAGQVNHAVDAGVIQQLPGRFTLTKVLDDITPGDLGPNPSFTFEVTTSLVAQPYDVTLNAANSWTYSSEDLPLGTQVTIEEDLDSLPSPPGFQWTGHVLSADGVTSGNPITFTIGAGQTTAVTATNTAQRLGVITVEKQLAGGDALAGLNQNTVFSVEYRVNGVDPWIPREIIGGNQIAIENLQPDSVVELRETPPDSGNPAAYWGTPMWSVNGGATQETETITVNLAQAGTGVAVVLTNTAYYTPVEVQIQKLLSGDWLAAGVGDATRFNIQYQIDGGTVNTVTVAGNDPIEIVGVLPTSVIRFREVAPFPTLNPGFVWAAPVLAGPRGEVAGGDGWLQFNPGVSSGPDTVWVATVTNAPLAPGGFSITKEVTGSDAARAAAAGTTFNIEYCLDDQCNNLNWTAVSLQDGQTFSLGGLAIGTDVQVRETQPADTFQLDWGTPVITPALFEITDPSASVSVTVQNPVTLLVGTVLLTKVVLDESTVPGTPISPSAAARFGFSWSTFPDVGSGLGELTSSSGPNGEAWVWESPPLPAGTLVTFTETLASIGQDDLLPGYRWQAGVLPTFNPPAPSPNQGEVRIVVGEQAPMSVTNHAEAVGTFTLDKVLSGDGAGRVPANRDFVLTYRVNDQDPTNEVTVRAGDDATAPLTFPVGTEITIGEITPIAPDGAAYQFGTPQFTVNGDTANTFQITQREQEFAVVVTNPVQALNGQLVLSKELIGIDWTTLGDESFRFQVFLGGQRVIPDPEISEASPTWSSGPQPIGSRITISELPPGAAQLPDGYIWVGNPRFSFNGTVTGFNQIVVPMSLNETAQVTAINQAQAVGQFSITKEVEGSARDLVADAEYSVTYALGDGGDITIDLIAGQTFTRQLIPVGTIVEISETLPGNTDQVVWSSPRFSVNGGPATSTARFSIGQAADEVDVILTNTANDPPPPLPITGTYGMPLVVTGFSILLVGLLTLLIAIRRRESPDST